MLLFWQKSLRNPFDLIKISYVFLRVIYLPLIYTLIVIVSPASYDATESVDTDKPTYDNGNEVGMGKLGTTFLTHGNDYLLPYLSSNMSSPPTHCSLNFLL